jgi:DNA-binding response OmpR family regulator
MEKKNKECLKILILGKLYEYEVGQGTSAKKVREAGCDGYITKPIDTRTFLGTIRKFIDGSR